MRTWPQFAIWPLLALLAGDVHAGPVQESPTGQESPDDQESVQPLVSNESASQAVALRDQAIKLLNQADNEGALLLLSDALLLDGSYGDAHRTRSAALMNLGRYEEAMTACRAALRCNPLDAKALFNMTLIRRDHLEDLPQALFLSEQVVRVNRQAADSYSLRASILVRLGQHKRALKDLDEASVRAPENVWNHWNRGHCLYVLGRYAESLTAYERAGVLAPHDPELWMNTGMVKRSLGRLDDALADFEAAAEHMTGSNQARGLMAEVLLEQGLRAPALKQLNLAADAAPEDLHVGSLRAALLLREGEIQSALAESERVLGRAADHPLGLWVRSHALRALGEIERADADLLKARAAWPDVDWPLGLQ